MILINGVADEPMSTTTVALQWDLPNAVAVHHEIDPARSLLVRSVSDVSGLLERVEIDVEHACVSCAIREDIVPTLERLAASGRWNAIIAQLPVSAEAIQVCRAISYAPDRVPHIRIAATIAALDAETLCDDLLGSDLVMERDLPTGADDDRGIAEIACPMVEYADVVTTMGAPDAEADALLRTLARPDARIVASAGDLDTNLLIAGIHRHQRNESWVLPVRRGTLPDPNPHPAWMLDFSSPLPMHPHRLHATIEKLGGGPRRSRGCFWLPSRPSQICGWDGAGGQLSIGPAGAWGMGTPLTRIVVVGLDDGRDELRAAFDSCLLTRMEVEHRGRFWEVAEDGLEPWLGPIRGAA